MDYGRYMSFHEIHKQYESLSQTLSYIDGNRDSLAGFNGYGDIVFVACGSSYWMSLSASVTMHSRTGRRSYAVKAGDVMLSPGDYKGRYDKPVFICPSRSGRTTEVLRALEILRGLYPGAKALSIVEHENTLLESVSDYRLMLPWANEQSVCQTRSFSNLYLASLLIIDIWSGGNIIADSAARYFKAAPNLYERHRKRVAEIAAGKPRSIVCLSYGRYYGVCIEGAYIVIEMAEQNSNYYQLLEYRHGPIVTAGTDTAVFILSAGGNEKYESSIAREAEKTGAKVYSAACKANEYGADTFSLEGEYPGEIVAMHFVFCLQSFAFYLSLENGKNPDSPGELTPFIEL